MGDDNKVAETIKAVAGVVEAVPVYKDAIQPAAKEIGVSLLTVTRAVNMVLAPVSALVWGYDKIKDFTTARVAEKLAGVPPAKIVSPKPEIAGPALEAMRYSGHDPDLRELYANLLATSMDADTASNAHPAFVEIIKNLSPDEARIMIAFVNTSQFPIVDFVCDMKGKTPGSFILLVENFSFIYAIANCTHQHLAPAYINNLCRMGLIEVDKLSMIEAPNSYEPLENDAIFDMAKKQVEATGNTSSFRRKILKRTNWGKQFCGACIVEKQGAAPKQTNTEQGAK